MNKHALIAPIITGLILTMAVYHWVNAFRSFQVPPRLAGQDGRPQRDQTQTQTAQIEGTLQRFDGSASALQASWPQFRGPSRSGIIHSDVPLARQWPAQGLPKLWEIQLGDGYAAPVVHNGCVYLVDYDLQAEADAIRCFSLDDGKEIWRYSYPVKIKRNHGMSRTIPAVTDRYLVAMGPKCHVTCLDAVSGQFRWMIDLVREFGATEPLWYAGQCPLIVDGKAILAPAGPDVLMMAVDCQTGQIVWKCPNPNKWKMTHTSILPMQFEGMDFYVYAASGGVAAADAAQGTLLWQTDAWFLRTNVPTPVDAGGGKIFLSAGYNKGSLMLQLERQGGKLIPKVLFTRPPEIFGSDQQTPIFYKGYIYGVRPDKQFVCLDTEGNIVWTSGSENRYGLGPYIIANDMIYLLNDDGVLSLIEASSEKFNLLSQTRVLSGHESWGPMALAAGRLLVRDLTTLVCLDVAAK
ncbi:MAG TPA: PQQ-like beta-propeller repeat protein [Anaerohalosphaeraceae bacterium]|nr:PQQ-like beta-propeller repeat protein [Anaerohalosphaeraceae bacterium]HOL31289.1 PQQ-like beta-propeller repeat protein [Anaerohalosphaeraceae bacterium]HOM76083.1 PQQ-like beta-propeller repeat protein [Anaerohalosphaeraceae bacterium]HPC64801.1 PQQ-like beta-propeller repeat protein [Anaerohalosphaeraceae bacterium]HPO70038.1 PQQ-like beta-propeller repeat protein [Anaerohalosphaeraceae bacterium]